MILNRAAAAFRYRPVLKSVVMLLMVVLGACVPLEQMPQVPEPVVTQQNDQAEKQLELQVKKLTNKIAGLELKLLEKQAEINQLMISQQNSISEAVLAKAKLRSYLGKAGAVAGMIETKMALKAIKVDQMNEQQKRILSQANSLILMSDKALDEGNLDGATFLSGKARQLILTISMQNKDDEQSDQHLEKVTFIIPLTMKTFRRSNVRDKPDINSEIQFQLEGDVQVNALWYTDKWIYVEDDTNRKGWVYYYLLQLAM